MEGQLDVAGGHDAPIQTAADDLLDGLGVARAIHRFLSTTPPSWSTRIGLFGRWGSGKTSILNLLRILAEAHGALVVSFSAWSASGEFGVIAQFYETLTARLRDEQIGLPRAQRAKQIAAKASGLGWLWKGGRTAVEEFAPLPPAAIKAGAAALDKLGAAASAWTKIGQSDLAAIVKLLQGRRVIVFVDDLDRADPKLVPKTLLAMRELLDWPGFAFVLAFDKRAVAGALAAYSTAFGDDADGFLEKVIDVPFEVPDPSKEHQERFALAAFRSCCDLMPRSSVAAIAPHLPSQPRRVKILARMMGALRPSLARHSTNEIDWMGLALYLILKEGSPDVADWVVRAASDEEGSWLLWASDEEERKKKRAEIQAALTALLASPKPPDDAARVIEAALRLLVHWEHTAKETIAYWSRLAFQEPAITMAELQSVSDAFAVEKRHELVDMAIGAAVRNANVSAEEASAELLKAAIHCYGTTLDSMAAAHTMADLEKGRASAERALLLLEYLYGQTANLELAAAAAKSGAIVPLTGLVGQWLGWTRNEGELGLRKRERELALAAAGRCTDPKAVFASTDPFWNSFHGQDVEGMRAWRDEVRKAVIPHVIAQLCAKLLEVDGMIPVASGSDNLGAWLVENGESPLYTEPTFAAQLLATLKTGASLTDDLRDTLSKNARLFLKQIMFQTRDASWGGREEGKTIHSGNPHILPAAWAAVVDSPAPFRMHHSLRKLRKDLVALGVKEGELLEPLWLAELRATPPASGDSTK
jgi:hypothetical protein